MKVHQILIWTSIAVFVIAFCERNKSVPQAPSSTQNAEVSYIGFQNNGCANQAAKSPGFFDPPRLLSHTLDGDTLILTFYLWANCCSFFQDSASITQESINIFLIELLEEEGCWCTCPFENDFKFRYIEGNCARIRFTAETSCYPDGPVTVDTTLVIP